MPNKKKRLNKKRTKQIQDKKLKNIDHILRSYHKLTFSQKAADIVTKFAGSWLFIILLTIFLFIWMVVNTTWLIFGKVWDPYPFILLNLTLSCLAAIQAPIILMSQNRAADRDRIKAEKDYLINRKAEKEINEIQKELRSIKNLIKKINWREK